MRKIFVIVLLAISTIAKSQTKAIYVSPAGNNDNSGEINAPLANLQGAFNRMQNMGRFDYNKLEIVLEDGNYQSAPIVMKPAMNGAKGTNIIIKAINPKKVVLSNAKKIKATNWSNITDPLLLKRLQAHLKDSILELSLSSIGLDQIKEFPDIFDGNGDLPYLFMDGEWMPLSTYPNEGKMAMCKVLVNGGGQEKPGSWKEYYSNPEIQKNLKLILHGQAYSSIRMNMQKHITVGQMQ